ncbi:hypothetical protein ABZX85_44095 [Streptomyces sp. NPDC004539]|uniref:hypothetical protein n=1 Tax=Streptomyces sp. NPDC004539 TaxID=3154280 RepID=UPI0033A6A685
MPSKQVVRLTCAVLGAALLIGCAVAAAGLHDPVRALQSQAGRMAVVIVCGVAGLVCAATALLMPSRRRVDRMAWLSAFTALVCLGSTVFI